MSEQTNNPPKKRVTSGAFKKGDARINRKGRPKTFDTLRREAIKLAGEIIVAQAENGEAVELSRIHSILLDWAQSKDWQAQKLFIEYAYGKVPQPQEVTGKDGGAQKLVIEVVRRDNANSPTGAAESSPETSAD